MTLADGNQYKLQISCMCAAVDRFACFAATLNCVIIKKAGVSCHSGTDTATSWWENRERKQRIIKIRLFIEHLFLLYFVI